MSALLFDCISLCMTKPSLLCRLIPECHNRKMLPLHRHSNAGTRCFKWQHLIADANSRLQWTCKTKANCSSRWVCAWQGHLTLCRCFGYMSLASGKSALYHYSGLQWTIVHVLIEFHRHVLVNTSDVNAHYWQFLDVNFFLSRFTCAYKLLLSYCLLLTLISMRSFFFLFYIDSTKVEVILLTICSQKIILLIEVGFYF